MGKERDLICTHTAHGGWRGNLASGDWDLREWEWKIRHRLGRMRRAMIVTGRKFGEGNFICIYCDHITKMSANLPRSLWTRLRHRNGHLIYVGCHLWHSFRRRRAFFSTLWSNPSLHYYRVWPTKMRHLILRNNPPFFLQHELLHSTAKV